MQQWLQDTGRDQRPAHDYAMERLGLSAAQLAQDFAAYRERFVLPHAH